ncbi:hypothetical protein MTO96_040699, partial [Rhipicephalus appendiculatus]
MAAVALVFRKKGSCKVQPSENVVSWAKPAAGGYAHVLCAGSSCAPLPVTVDTIRNKAVELARAAALAREEFHARNSLVQPGAGAQTARFPAFASPPSTLEHDASLAKTCCSVAHAMQRLLDKLCRCHGQLSKAPHALSCVLEEQTEKQMAKLNQAKTINNLLDQQLRLLSVSHCDLCDLAELLQPQMQSNELLRLARTLADKRESQAAMTEQVSKLMADVAHLEQRILKGRSLRKEWESLCAGVPNLQG